jgi:hypothetical protein
MLGAGVGIDQQTYGHGEVFARKWMGPFSLSTEEKLPLGFGRSSQTVWK